MRKLFRFLFTMAVIAGVVYMLKDRLLPPPEPPEPPETEVAQTASEAD